MIYFVRHGQTAWNVLKIYQGHKDIELDETGLQQAYEMKEKLAGITFDIVFSSPLKRAFKTAQIIYDGKIITDDRLKERCCGDMEGQYTSQIKIDFADPNDTRFNVEPLLLFRKRINAFWDDVLRLYPNKNVLVVAHAGIGIYSQCYFKGEPKDGDYSTYYIQNCEVLTFDNTAR